MDQMLADVMSEAFSNTARGNTAINSLGEIVKGRMVRTPQGITLIVECGEAETYNRFEFVGVERNDLRSIAQAVDLLFN